MSPSLYTSQITLINDESMCTHVSVCPRLVFNLPWGWLTTQQERTTTHFFSSLLSVFVRVSGESDAEEKQRRFQESLMSTRSRSLPNYPCLSFSFCLFSSLYHPLRFLIFSFTRRESNRCLPCCGVEVKWRWSCLLVERLVPWEACLRSVAVKTKVWSDLVSGRLQSHYHIRLTFLGWVLNGKTECHFHVFTHPI